VKKGDSARQPVIQTSEAVLSRTEMRRTYKAGQTEIVVNSIFSGDEKYTTLLYRIVRGKMRDYSERASITPGAVL